MHQTTWSDVLRFIGHVLWTIIRITMVIAIAVVIGGIKGASKAKAK